MPLDRIPGPCCIAFAGHWDGRPGRWHWSWLRGKRVSAVEEKIGVVTDYLNQVGVAVVRLTDGDLRLGDRVRSPVEPPTSPRRSNPFRSSIGVWSTRRAGQRSP